MKSLGQRVKEIREAKGWSVYQLRKASGVHETQIARLESGERPNPQWLTVLKLADALGVKLDTLRG